MTNEPEGVQEVETRFQPSNFCRTIHIDGALGGVTPTLNVHMSVYSEHRAPPAGSTVSIDPDGRIQERMKDDPRTIVREIEGHMIFSEATAIALRDWLALRINELQTARLELTKRSQPEN